MVINGITKYRAGAPPGLRNPTNVRRENFRGARTKDWPRFIVPHYGYIVSNGRGRFCVIQLMAGRRKCASLPRCLPNYRGLISISTINCIGIRPTRRTKIFHFDEKGREFLSDTERERKRERELRFPFVRRNLSLT